MTKIASATLAVRYWRRTSTHAKRTSWKGCEFCKKPLVKGDEIKPASGYQQPAHVNCVKKLVPAHILNPPKEVAAPVVDKTKHGPVIVKPIANPRQEIDSTKPEVLAPQVMQVQPNFAKLLEQAQENVRFSQQQLAEAHKEIKTLRTERDQFLRDQTLFTQLVDECLKLMAAGQKIQSSQFLTERSAIKRVLVLMQRWAA